MFLFNGSMFPFLFRVLVTLISVYTFSVCYFCGFVTFDLNIFLHLIKKKSKFFICWIIILSFSSLILDSLHYFDKIYKDVCTVKYHFDSSNWNDTEVIDSGIRKWILTSKFSFLIYIDIRVMILYFFMQYIYYYINVRCKFHVKRFLPLSLEFTKFYEIIEIWFCLFHH
jgi:hypothetical protein